MRFSKNKLVNHSVEARKEFTATVEGSILRIDLYYIIGNLVVQLVPGVLLVFECRFGLVFSLVLDTGSELEGEYLGLEFTERGPTLGRVGLGA